MPIRRVGRLRRRIAYWTAAVCMTTVNIPATSAAEAARDMVELRSVIPGIFLDIRYATPANFTGEILYDTAACFVRRAVAERLEGAWLELRSYGYALKVFDAYRPYAVTLRMWELVGDPRYVATPGNGSRHNRGAALDLTLVTLDGDELEMPSDFDDFSERAHHDYTGASAAAIRRRELLRDVMRRHGFLPYRGEWWHYDAADWRSYPILDIPLRDLLEIAPTMTNKRSGG